MRNHKKTPDKVLLEMQSVQYPSNYEEEPWILDEVNACPINKEDLEGCQSCQ